MAEVVELRLEKGVDELLELERCGLFTSEEIRIVIKKRKEMEYRLRRMKKCKQDYLKYISYEDSLLQLVKIRRKKTGFNHRYKEIERSMASRIAGIYKNMVTRYKSDLQLWLSYIEFCRKQKWNGNVSSLFNNMLKVHNKNEDIWVLAARWESQFNNSIDTARSLMQQALRFNPESRTLFREYLSLELNYAEKIIRRKDIMSKSISESDKNVSEEDPNTAATDAIMSGEVTAVVFETAINRIPDPEFAIELISCLAPFGTSFKDTLEAKMIQEVRNRFPGSEEVLQLMCERDVKTADRDLAFDTLVQRYEDAVARKASVKMFTFYLKALLRVLSSPQFTIQRKAIVAKLNSVFDSAFEQNCLSVEMYSEWLLVYKALIIGSSRARESRRKELDDILVRVTNKIRDDPKVWPISLSIKMETSSGTDYEMIHRLFQRGLDRLSSFVTTHPHVPQPDADSIREYVDAYAEWAVGKIAPKLILTVLDSCSSGKVFTVATTCGRCLTAHFRSLLLTIASRVDSLDSAFRLYRKHKDRQPLTPQIFRTMIHLSSGVDAEITDEVYDDYLNEYGSSDYLIWVDFVKHLIAKGAVTAIAGVYERALRNLSPDQQIHFMSAYSLLVDNRSAV